MTPRTFRLARRDGEPLEGVQRVALAAHLRERCAGLLHPPDGRVVLLPGVLFDDVERTLAEHHLPADVVTAITYDGRARCYGVVLTRPDLSPQGDPTDADPSV